MIRNKIIILNRKETDKPWGLRTLYKNDDPHLQITDVNPLDIRISQQDIHKGDRIFRVNGLEGSELQRLQIQDILYLMMEIYAEEDPVQVYKIYLGGIPREVSEQNFRTWVYAKWGDKVVGISCPISPFDSLLKGFAFITMRTSLKEKDKLLQTEHFIEGQIIAVKEDGSKGKGKGKGWKGFGKGKGKSFQDNMITIIPPNLGRSSSSSLSTEIEYDLRSFEKKPDIEELSPRKRIHELAERADQIWSTKKKCIQEYEESVRKIRELRDLFRKPQKINTPVEKEITSTSESTEFTESEEENSKTPWANMRSILEKRHEEWANRIIWAMNLIEKEVPEESRAKISRPKEILEKLSKGEWLHFENKGFTVLSELISGKDDIAEMLRM